MQVVAHHRRHDAGRAVGRRGDDAAAGGILLVDRHRVDRQPVIGEQRVAAVVRASSRLQLVVDLAGAAPHLEPARHDAVLREAALDAGAASPSQMPSRPPIELGARARASSLARFISAIARPTLPHRQHLGGVGERIGIARRPFCVGQRVGLSRLRGAQLGLGRDEAAADRIVGPLEQHRAGRVAAPAAHAVGVSRERAGRSRRYVGVRGRRPRSGRPGGARRPVACSAASRASAASGSRLAGSTPSGRGSPPGRLRVPCRLGERAVELASSPVRAPDRTPAARRRAPPPGTRPPPSSAPWCATRRADADLEDVEHADEHGSPPGLAAPVGRRCRRDEPPGVPLVGHGTRQRKRTATIAANDAPSHPADPRRMRYVQTRLGSAQVSTVAWSKPRPRRAAP